VIASNLSTFYASNTDSTEVLIRAFNLKLNDIFVLLDLHQSRTPPFNNEKEVIYLVNLLRLHNMVV